MKMEPTAPLFRPVGGAHEALKSLVLGFKYTGTTSYHTYKMNGPMNMRNAYYST